MRTLVSGGKALLPRYRSLCDCKGGDVKLEGVVCSPVDRDDA